MMSKEKIEQFEQLMKLKDTALEIPDAIYDRFLGIPNENVLGSLKENIVDSQDNSQFFQKPGNR